MFFYEKSLVIFVILVYEMSHFFWEWLIWVVGFIQTILMSVTQHKKLDLKDFILKTQF